MKKHNGQKSAPAVSSAGVSVDWWSQLQLAAAGRGVTTAEQLGAKRRVAIAVRLPSTFVTLLQSLLEARSIPAAKLGDCLANALLAMPVTEWSPLVSDYLYPNRREAYRAAIRVFARDRHEASVVLRFRSGRGTSAETFRNPLRNLNAA